VTFALSADGHGGGLRLRGTAGEVLRGAVRARNVSGRAITVVLRPAGIRNAANGNADYVTTRLSAPGRWLRLAATTVQLAPYATRRVAFTVSVPVGTSGASHYAGIVATDAADLAAAARAKRAKAGSFTFSRITRQALPLTIRLPGPRLRSLALRSSKLIVAPVGAGLVLGMLPGGTELIQATRVRLRVLRGTRTVFTHAATLGQLFPGAGLSYRIPWRGRPVPGTYRMRGVIRPQGAAAVHVDRTVEFTSAGATRLERATPPAVAPSAVAPGAPTWVWSALAGAGLLLVALLVTLAWVMRRRPPPAGRPPAPAA
jgi:hypothetical protein